MKHRSCTFTVSSIWQSTRAVVHMVHTWFVNAASGAAVGKDARSLPVEMRKAVLEQLISHDNTLFQLILFATNTDFERISATTLNYSLLGSVIMV